MARKINVQKLKKGDVIIYGGKEYYVTSIRYDNVNQRVNVFGTEDFAQSIPLNSTVTIK